MCHCECSGCIGDLVHIWPGLPHVRCHGTPELHGRSSGYLHDCWGLLEWSGTTLQGTVAGYAESHRYAFTLLHLVALSVLFLLVHFGALVSASLPGCHWQR